MSMKTVILFLEENSDFLEFTCMLKFIKPGLKCFLSLIIKYFNGTISGL